MTTGDLSVLFGLLSLVALKVEAENGVFKWDQPMWVIYHPDSKWDLEALPKWFARILLKMLGENAVK